MYVAAKRATRLPTDPDLAFCYDVLNRVSRSFAVVIQQLPNPLRDAVCVFYLVLRGLDTVEDDMALDDRVKVPALLAFHERIFEPLSFLLFGSRFRICRRRRPKKTLPRALFPPSTHTRLSLSLIPSNQNRPTETKTAASTWTASGTASTCA